MVTSGLFKVILAVGRLVSSVNAEVLELSSGFLVL